jgi:outer membrane lipoprotein carrier protein
MIRGVPRGLEDRVEQVVLEITPERRIARILIHATDDSVTEYRFSNQKENVEIADKAFRFTAPAGTEVIEDNSGNGEQ